MLLNSNPPRLRIFAQVFAVRYHGLESHVESALPGLPAFSTDSTRVRQEIQACPDPVGISRRSVTG